MNENSTRQIAITFKHAWMWIVLSVLFQSLAFTLSKQGGIESANEGIVSVVINPWYVGMLLALAMRAICWVLALRRFDLNVAYPLMSFTLPLNLVIAYFIFNEPVHPMQVVAFLLIVLGAYILSGSNSNKPMEAAHE